MKSVRDVYKKLREVRFRYLVILYKRYLKRAPDLCKYNREFRVESNGQARFIRLCMLHQPEKGLAPNLLDVCEQVGHCEECNAFVCRHTKDSIKEMFESQLKDPRVKARTYPEIAVLEWVLEQDVNGIRRLSWFEKIITTIKGAFQKGVTDGDDKNASVL